MFKQSLEKIIIDVSSNGDCLFWATMMGYLDVVKTDEMQFQSRYKKLFGNNTNWKEMYNNFAQFDFKDKKNYHFVSIFRKNVVNYMKTIKNEIKQEWEKTENQGWIKSFQEQYNNHPNNPTNVLVVNIESYLELMEKDYIWGGEWELDAISKLLNIEIQNYEIQNNTTGNTKNVVLTHTFSDTKNENQEKIKLLYINRNHFQYISGNNENIQKTSLENKNNSFKCQKIVENINQLVKTNEKIVIDKVKVKMIIKNNYQNDNIDNQTYNGIIDMYIDEFSKIPLDQQNEELSKIIFELNNQDKIFNNPNYCFEKHIKLDVNNNFEKNESSSIESSILSNKI